MIHSPAEIYESLIVIKDECDGADVCDDCIFYSGEYCELAADPPRDWKLNLPPEIWRPFQ